VLALLLFHAGKVRFHFSTFFSFHKVSSRIESFWPLIDGFSQIHPQIRKDWADQKIIYCYIDFCSVAKRCRDKIRGDLNLFTHPSPRQKGYCNIGKYTLVKSELYSNLTSPTDHWGSLQISSAGGPVGSTA
jgi:hypothetical protein